MTSCELRYATLIIEILWIVEEGLNNVHSNLHRKNGKIFHSALQSRLFGESLLRIVCKFWMWNEQDVPSWIQQFQRQSADQNQILL